jgi:microcystin-dependent protein|tara:strand:+ start:1998 stop:2615 length:618 start_codon:yes stop_codon:yes gene_type:complete
MAFGGGSSGSAGLTAHTHNATLAGDGGDLSETLTDMNGVSLYSLITDNSAAVAANTAAIALINSTFNSVPSGAILIWSGAVVDIPSGWNLCDGNNGTINLSNKFVRSGTSIGTTGGADTVTLTGAESGLVSHNHSITDPGHTHTSDALRKTFTGNGQGPIGTQAFTATINSATTGISVNNVSAQDASSSHQNMPAYYELAYIQKS